MIVFPFRRQLMKIIPRASQKTDTMALPANGVVFAFFRANSPLSVYCFDCFFVSSVKWWTYVSSMVMNRRKKSALSLRNIGKHLIESSLLRCFCSIVCKRCTHLAHIFLMSKLAVNMRCTVLFEISTMFASWRNFSRRSSNIISWIFFTIFVVGTFIWSITAMFVLAAHTQYFTCRRRANSFFRYR